MCGVYLGSPENLVEGSPDNFQGYWEDKRILSINDRILGHFGGSWDQPPKLTEGWLTEPAIRDLAAEASCILEEYEEHCPWAWKDPRTCITGALWASIVPDLRLVVCLRSPVECAASLVNRRDSNVPFERGLSLWMEYNTAVSDLMRSLPSVVIRATALFRSPATELARICGLLEISPSQAQLDAACSSIDPDLRRSVPLETERLEEELPDSIKALYRVLLSASGSEGGGHGDDVDRRTPKDLAEACQRIRQLERLLADKNEFHMEMVVRHVQTMAHLEADRADLRREIAAIVATRWHRLGVGINRVIRRIK
jgi:hypothetical protein